MKDTKRQNRMWGSKGIIGKRDCPGPTRGKQTNDLYSTRGHITPQPLCGLLNRSLCVSACYDAAADNHHNTCVVGGTCAAESWTSRQLEPVCVLGCAANAPVYQRLYTPASSPRYSDGHSWTSTQCPQPVPVGLNTAHQNITIIYI